uniref:L1 transposable element RRM domain-containing protein n=1 Tax=Latimeria chalumnae TaxID=7897 RepID=H3A364_LATCH
TKSMESILRDIHQTNSHIEDMDKKIEAFTKHMEEAERRTGDTEDLVHTMETLVQQLQETINKLQDKADDLENRSRRCNLRLVGLPEGEEAWLPTLLNLPELSDNLEIERAHRTFLSKVRNVDRPRMLLFKLLRYRDKETILRQARNLGPLTFNKPIYLFPDMRKRKSFSDVKWLCKDLAIPFALLFPARLRVDFQ